MQKVFLLTCSLIVIVVTGCGGPSSEVLAVTMVAGTDVASTQTRAAMPTSTLTKTSTPVPTDTPIPTKTPTEIPTTPTLNPQIENYYPLQPNTVWWFVLQNEGKFLGMTSFTMLSVEEYKDGSLVYPIVNRNGLGPELSHNIEYARVNNDGVELVRMTMIPSSPDVELPEYNDIEFTPPIPFIKFPLEVGNTWERIGNDGQVVDAYEVISREDISVPYGDFKDCYLIERVTDGEPTFREMYCSEVGRVFFEHNNFGPWVQYLLFDLTSARIEITAVSKDTFINNCLFELSFHGFSNNEVVSVAAMTADSGMQPLIEDFPLSHDNITLSYAISSTESAGNYLIFAKGDEHNAMYLIEYGGECKER